MALQSVYDVCVIGAGLWGSAAAYHASLKPETKVCLIGPDEPKSIKAYNYTTSIYGVWTTLKYFKTCGNRTVFGAYYDEARIVCISGVDANIPDAELALGAHRGFHVLQKETGILFYTPCPNLTYGKVGSEVVEECKASIKPLGVEHQVMTNEQLTRRFPFMAFENGYEGVLELSQCGLVNPRKLVEAQRTAAHLHGCDIVKAIVDNIYPTYDNTCGARILNVVTDNGQIVRSRRVLLCTGAFTMTKPLIPRQLLPDVKLVPSQTLKFEVSADDAEVFGGMPMFVFQRSNDPLDNGYWCPPVVYRNGKSYLKIGHDRLGCLQSYDGITDWYRGNGNPEVSERLKDSMKAILPGFEPKSIETYACLLTTTETKLPIIDMITPEIGIAVGGNGEGARWSYEVGKMAARMINKGCWDYDLPKEHFKIQFKNTNFTSKL